MITDVFLDQRRVNVSEHMINSVQQQFWKSAIRVGAREEGGGVEGKDRKLNGSHLRLIQGLCLEDRMN